MAIASDRPALLEVKDLQVRLRGRGGWIYAVNGIDLVMHRGETLALVGESGSGKSMTALAIVRLLPKRTAVVEGTVLFDGTDVLKEPENSMRRLRGSQLAMLFQDPSTALDPVRRIGGQVAEGMLTHLQVTRSEAAQRSAALLGQVGIFNPKETMRRYPHELSGGMRQRALIAAVLGLKPRLLIADEPTTALDATIQAQVLDLLQDMTKDSGAALLLITHDLAVAATISVRAAVMYAGTIVETAGTGELMRRPFHPYTLALLKSVPRLASGADVLVSIQGSPPDGRLPITNCPFAPRCRWRLERCWLEVPPLEPPERRARASGHEAQRPGSEPAGASPARLVACFNPPTEDEIESGTPQRPGFVPAQRPEQA
jgi:oligopeptide transport system ATP-binding protein